MRCWMLCGGVTGGHNGIGPNSINPIECVRVLTFGVNTTTKKKYVFKLNNNILYTS